MNCPACGKELKEGAKFCGKCGLLVSEMGIATTYNPRKPPAPPASHMAPPAPAAPAPAPEPVPVPPPAPVVPEPMPAAAAEEKAAVEEKKKFTLTRPMLIGVIAGAAALVITAVLLFAWPGWLTKGSNPVQAQAEATSTPAAEATAEPTAEPTPEPTPVPTAEPTPVPTAEPTAVPTSEPKPAEADDTPTVDAPDDNVFDFFGGSSESEPPFTQGDDGIL